jgi:hypothetical protein
MKQTLKIMPVLLAVILIGYSCKDEEQTPPVKEFILGKWQLVAQGITEEDVTPVTPDDNYKEYFRDGKMAFYKNGVYTKYTDRIYKMDDIYLYIEFNRKIFGTNSDQTDEYHYDSSTDLLTLKIIKGLIPGKYPYYYITVHQRIK